MDVYDIGLCGTEEIYFATAHAGMGGGIMVTASHNPRDYNGLKFVRAGAQPISGDSGLRDIQALAEADGLSDAAQRGERHALDTSAAYTAHLLSYVDIDKLRPLKLVVNAGNGGAGLVIDRLEGRLPFTFVKILHEPDGAFPSGVPNPLLPDNRAQTREAVLAHGADLGIAWDGDFDRCFFFDESGAFVEGYYLVGLLAEAFLRREGGGRIVHDPRLTWSTIELVERFGGEAVQSKTGHAFIKERMRQEDAVYGGEMSAHHYFRDFAYCDSGMIPWLLVAGLISQRGQPLSALVAERVAAYPCSGEINRRVLRSGRPARRGRGPVRRQRGGGGSHRWTQYELRGVAVQPAPLQHRAGGPPQRREPRRRGADAAQDRRAARPHRRLTATPRPAGRGGQCGRRPGRRRAAHRRGHPRSPTLAR